MTGAQGWADALDALEEWVRRLDDGVRTGVPLQLGPAPELPDGPVPSGLKVRALALQSAMTDALAAGRENRLRLGREQTYLTG